MATTVTHLFTMGHVCEQVTRRVSEGLSLVAVNSLTDASGYLLTDVPHGEQMGHRGRHA